MADRKVPQCIDGTTHHKYIVPEGKTEDPGVPCVRCGWDRK